MGPAISSTLGRLCLPTIDSLGFCRGRSTLARPSTLGRDSNLSPCDCACAESGFHPLRMDLRILLLSGKGADGGGDGGRSDIEGCEGLADIDFRTGYGDS
jgi:hypothetical protein